MNKNLNISKKVEQLAPSGIRAFFDLVLGMKEVISLGVGEPDFVTPWHIREEAIYALEKGYTSYTSNKGMIELRKEIARFLERRFGLSYDPENEILVTIGVSEAVDLAMRTILNPGEKVLIPQPSYVSYGPTVDLAGGKPVFLETDIKSGFKITAKQIDRAFTPGTKALMINYPANPTGTSYNKEQLRDIARVVLKRNMFVISDEVYDELTYDFDHTPMASFKGMKKHVIYLNGFSKAYAMTGFRIGWAAGPANVIAGMTKIHQYTIMCVPTISQMAAVEALKNSFKDVLDMKREYMRRRRFIVNALNEMGLDCHNPEGAFYVLPSIKSTGKSSMQFSQELLERKKVAVVPGTAFGKSMEGHVRMSYASSYENLKEAMARIKSYLGK
ncbi:MAG TPA: aminotransferase class I/II-fold pyridoxal phosphate-dependent enzyme [Candidatus Omnitrophota bacterium]|nr:aminotransferase class I/II-fold pyridoxal phosphate-dependent enzyme [Candidatus Omnitrophota bacterium]HPD84480.1 aminotransferase class I/II-fold pyridoxal phosphate-dependent enzyme [Candidatus Omnitrophota bacterium]HRZ03338.1 aminotransferase class I/II-fold pyridoxal phosphate-dependent enzyme [Candidatus Omnitrophota bacterium]